MQLVQQRQIVLRGVTATGQGQWFPDLGTAPTFHAQVTGTGAVSASITIWARNIESGTGLVSLGAITLSGTSGATDAAVTQFRYMEYMAEVTAISGTGAAVTVVMAS